MFCLNPMVQNINFLTGFSLDNNLPSAFLWLFDFVLVHAEIVACGPAGGKGTFLKFSRFPVLIKNEEE